MVYMLQIVILLNLSLQSIRNECTIVITGIVECCLAPLSVRHIQARRAQKQINHQIWHYTFTYVIDIQ